MIPYFSFFHQPILRLKYKLSIFQNILTVFYFQSLRHTQTTSFVFDFFIFEKKSYNLKGKIK